MNALSPRGIPWLPLTHHTDQPPENQAELEGEDSEYITLDMLSEASQFGTMMGAAVIDARTPQEFADGHVPNAINLPVEAFRENELLQLEPTDADSPRFSLLPHSIRPL